MLGTADAKAGETSWPIAMIQREEHDGTRQYYIEEDTIRMVGESGVMWAEVLAWFGADLILVPSYFYVMGRARRQMEKEETS